MHNGSQIQELMDIVTELCRAHPEVFSRCACGNMMIHCECPKYGDEWKAYLEDAPENQR
jgi:hypothetical protein